MVVRVCVFDAYGTLFDVAGAARIVAAEDRHPGLGPTWERLASLWRTKQLEYTWLRSAMGSHADFAQVTAEALDWAMAAAGLDDPGLRARLLDLYRRLPAYPEVPPMLAALRARGIPAAILSNGTPGMLADATGSAGIDGAFDAVLSVESVGIYKPAPEVYRLVTARFGCAPHQVLFMSSNGWDVAGAAAFGFRTFWANRRAEPVDRLPGLPDHIAPDLSQVPEIATR